MCVLTYKDSLVTLSRAESQFYRTDERREGLQLGTICAKSGSGTQPNNGEKMKTLEITSHKLYFIYILSVNRRITLTGNRK